MELFIAALVVFAVVMASMAVGVIFSDRCIKGSCGGAYGQQDAEGNMVCGVCGVPVDKPKNS